MKIEKGLEMKKKLLAVVVLSTFANAASASAAVSYQDVAGVLYNRGVFVALSAGAPSGIDGSPSTLDATTSYSAMLGYQVYRTFSIEAGQTQLYNQTNLTLAGQTTGSQVTLSGTEVAGIFSLPMSKMFAPFIRIGTANMTYTSGTTVNGVTTTTNTSVSGPTYGAGVQIGLSKSMSARMGYSAYNLKDSTNATITPKNTYVTLVFKF